MTAKIVDQLTVNKRLKMRNGGMTLQEIADAEGVSKQAIQQQLQKYIPNPVKLETYKQHRADILAAKQIELLQSLTASKIKDASALQLITGMGILTDKERLERGQSTQNIETVVHSITSEVEELRKLKAKLLGNGDN